MKYVLLDENNVVIQTQPNFQEGFIAAPDEVSPGDIYDPLLGTFSPPPPPPLVRGNFARRLRDRIEALREAQFQALLNSALALSPNHPDLPNSMADFDTILDGMTLPV